MGESHAIGMSVNTLHNRTAAPNSGVTNLFNRLNSPSPASMAKGTLCAVSLMLGMAWYPSPRMNSASDATTNALWL